MGMPRLYPYGEQGFCGNYSRGSRSKIQLTIFESQGPKNEFFPKTFPFPSSPRYWYSSKISAFKYVRMVVMVMLVVK